MIMSGGHREQIAYGHRQQIGAWIGREMLRKEGNNLVVQPEPAFIDCDADSTDRHALG